MQASGSHIPPIYRRSCLIEHIHAGYAATYNASRLKDATAQIESYLRQQDTSSGANPAAEARYLLLQARSLFGDGFGHYFGRALMVATGAAYPRLEAARQVLSHWSAATFTGFPNTPVGGRGSLDSKRLTREYLPDQEWKLLAAEMLPEPAIAHMLAFHQSRCLTISQSISTIISENTGPIVGLAEPTAPQAARLRRLAVGYAEASWRSVRKHPIQERGALQRLHATLEAADIDALLAHLAAPGTMLFLGAMTMVSQRLFETDPLASIREKA